MKTILSYLWAWVSDLECWLRCKLYPDYVSENVSWWLEYVGKTSIHPDYIIKDLEIGKLRIELKQAQERIKELEGKE